MKSTVSAPTSILNNTKRSHQERIIKELAEKGKMNKYDLKDTLKLQYPRVSEAISALKKKGLVEKGGEKTAQNGFPSPLYDLTFKGALNYLSLEELKSPRTLGITGETSVELRKRAIKNHEEDNAQLRKICGFLKSWGRNHNFQIFEQIDWLLKNYNDTIVSAILDLASIHVANPPGFLSVLQERNNVELRQLKKESKLLGNTPPLEKMVVSLEDGAGRIEEEIDLLEDTRARLEHLKSIMEQNAISENEVFRVSFSNAFFERLSLLPNVLEHGNASLSKVASGLLAERRKALESLENVAAKLGLP